MRIEGAVDVRIATIVLMLSLVSGGAVATTFTGAVAAVASGDMAGDGTEVDPYVITSATQLQSMQEDLSAHYVLGNDIDASETRSWNGGKGFDPIGDGTTGFSGTFDGNGNTISNLFIDRGSERYVGLFSYIETGASVVDVGLKNATVTATGQAAILAGRNDGTIERSFATGDVDATSAEIGGLVGHNSGNVLDTYASVDVTSSWNYVGGLVGMQMDGTVARSYAVGSVDGYDREGGLAGDYRGGLVTDSYWNTETTGQASNGAGTGLTTAQMTGLNAETTMNGFDFDAVWATTDGYPDLQAPFELVNLIYSDPSLAPTTLYSGSDVTGTVTVENAGGQTGEYAVSLSVNGDSIWQNGTLHGGDSKTVTIKQTLSDAGNQTVTITGGSSSATETVTVEVDTTAPPAPLTPDIAAVSDTGSSNTDDVTSDTTPTITGTAEANAIVEVVSDQDGSLGTTTADETGDWSFTPGSALSPGTHDVTAIATDAAGNTGPASPNLPVTIDTTTPSITDPHLQYYPAAPGSDGKIEFSFESTEPLDTRAISASVTGTESATLTSFDEWDGDGYWVYFVEYSATTDGPYTVTLDTAKDDAGHDGASDQSLSDTYDVTRPTITNYTVTNPTGRVIRLSLTADEPLSGIEVDITGAETGTVDSFTETMNGDGTYTYVADYAGSIDGLYAAELWSARDEQGNGGIASRTKSVTVDVTAPTADTGSNRVVAEDTLTSFDGSTSEDNLGIHSYSWEYGDGNSSTGETTTHTYAQPGVYTVSLTVADTGGNTDTDTAEITVEDVTIPTADAGVDRVVDEDITVAFDASNASDNVDITSYSWDFGDGSTATGRKTTHTYVDPGTYTATLHVSDAAGHDDTDSIVLTVKDATPPSAPLPPDLKSSSDTGTSNTDDLTNETVPTLTGTAEANAIITVTSDQDGALGTTTADGNGDWLFTPAAVLSAATHRFTVTATDTAGNTGPASDSLPVTVDTLTPNVEAGADQTVDEDVSTGFDGTASTDKGGVIAYEWDFGDGSATTTGATPIHTFDDPGPYTVALNVTDAAGNADHDTLTVTVADVTTPTADAGTNRTIDEDTTVTFDGSPSTDNVGVTGYTWAFGDGSANATGATPTHTYADPGTYTVVLNVTDNAANIDLAAVTVTVTDTTPPTANAGNDTTSRAGTTIEFNATQSSDNVDVTNYEWDYGDGTHSTNASGFHRYISPGTYAVTLTVTDMAGNHASDVRNITVKPLSQSSRPVSSPTDEPDVAVNSPAERDSSWSNVSITDVKAETPILITVDPSGNGSSTNESNGADDEFESRPGNSVNISVAQLTVNTTSSEDFTLNITTHEQVENDSVDGAFQRDTGATPAGYVVVEHSISENDITDVTFQFRVRKLYLEARGLETETVALYRDEKTQWRRLNTTLINETATHYVFEATSPGLSVFTIGSAVPVFDLINPTLGAPTTKPGESVDVTFSIANSGGITGTFTDSILANGNPIADTALSVAAFDEQTTTLSVALDQPGTYKLTLAEESIGTLIVEGKQVTESKPGPTPVATDSNRGSANDRVSHWKLIAIGLLTLSVIGSVIVRLHTK